MTLFEIYKNGEFSGIRIENPHDLDAVNEAARKAIQEACPMRVPNPYRREPIKIEFNFDYNGSN